jgi:sarcosine oxidase subunit gamma
MTRKENVTMSEIILESPLAGIARLGQRVLSVDGRSCSLGEDPFIEMINLRGSPANAGLSQAVLSAIGLDLPLVPNTAHQTGHRQILWMGPDEWLLKLPRGEGGPVLADLRASLQGTHHSLVQVGDGNTTFTLQGDAAADLLARGCPLDLHPRVFSAGMLAQTHIAKAGATLLCLEAGTRFELTVRRSFADYLFRWLCEAGT